MHRTQNGSWHVARFGLFFCLLAGVVVAASQEKKKLPDVTFARTTVDLGIVVSDIDKAVTFYRDALGFTELEGFNVPGDFAKDSGLADNHPFHVHVMTLGEGDQATKVKLMQFKSAPGRQVDNEYIHSSLGISYLTIFVDDIDASVQRAAQCGVQPMAKGPVSLPEGFPQGIYLACVKDPDGNIIELVGPKK